MTTATPINEDAFATVLKVDTPEFQNHMKQFFTAHDTIKMSAVYIYHDIEKTDEEAGASVIIWGSFPVPGSTWGLLPGGTDKDKPPLFDKGWQADGNVSWYEMFFRRTKQGAALYGEIENCKAEKAKRRKSGSSTADLQGLDSDIKLARQRIDNAVALLRKAVQIHRQINAVVDATRGCIVVEIKETTDGRAKRHRKPIVLIHTKVHDRTNITMEDFLDMVFKNVDTSSLIAFIHSTKNVAEEKEKPIAAKDVASVMSRLIETMVKDGRPKEDIQWYFEEHGSEVEVFAKALLDAAQAGKRKKAA